MRTMYVAAGNAVAVLRHQQGVWRATLGLEGMPAQCVAADPLHPATVYAGTFGKGLWRSRDAGATWQPAGPGIPHQEIMSVAVSPLERIDGQCVVWAGTEPSALFRSEDGGATWTERDALRRLPSAPTWSFAPRPWTSHIRWIQPDPRVAERLFAGIELGGVMRSLDGGLTWEDRKSGGQHDCHTLAMHRQAPDRVYEAAGGGYAESVDGGSSWQRLDDGLTRHYTWGLAVDPGDPDTVLISAAHGPRQAHVPGQAEAAIYRRTAGAAWQEVGDGLPAPRGTNAYVLAANNDESGVFYAATRRGDLYRSGDTGQAWESQPVSWPAGYQPQEVRAMVVMEV
jgi:photosystem II stability/assembly factor-like uncharacterized protein